MGAAKDLGQRWFEMQGADVATLAAALTDDCDFRTPGGRIDNPQEAAGYISAFATAFPDARFEVEHWYEVGDSALAEGVYSGTHTGTLGGPQGEIPATGRSVSVPFVTVFQERDGKLAAHRAYWDNATFMGQLLGMMPG